MKKLLVLYFGLMISIAVLADTIGAIKVGYNSRKSALKVQFKCEFKKSTEAVLYIINDKGKVEFTKASILIKGENIILLENILKLNEGNYTVKVVADSTEQTTKFTIWK